MNLRKRSDAVGSTRRWEDPSALRRYGVVGELLARAGSRTRARSIKERDEALHDLVTRYRCGRTAELTQGILDLLAPELLYWLLRFRPQPPVIDHEDLAQQMVTEALAVATTLPVDCGARWLDRRIVNRARERVLRSLRRELGEPNTMPEMALETAIIPRKVRYTD